MSPHKRPRTDCGAVAASAVAQAQSPIQQALLALGGLSPNTGMYGNLIPPFTHAAAFVEVCFKDGDVLRDQVLAGTVIRSAATNRPR